MPIKKYRTEIEFIILFVVLALIWYAGRNINIDTRPIEESLRNFPLAASGIIYIILYIIVTFFLFFSKDVFWVAGAVIFGPLWSTVFICLAEFGNAFILFNLARKLGRGYVEKNTSDKYKNLDEKLGRISLLWLIIFRAAPLIPYRFMDLAAGLTRIDFRKYLAGAVIGTPVKTFWQQYILWGVGLAVLKDPTALAHYFMENRVMHILSLFYAGLVVAAIIKLAAKD